LARDWRAFLGREDDDTVTVQVFCPECARTEFGLDRSDEQE
jgi:hypothetical protein